MVVRATAAASAKPKPKPRSGAKASARVTKKPTPAAEGGTATVAKPRRKAKVESRTRIYWAVFNQNLKRVAVFEFDQKVEAEKRAAKLTTSSGEDHFIQKLKATVQ